MYVSGASLFMRLFLVRACCVRLRDDIDGTNKTRQATEAAEGGPCSVVTGGGDLFTGDINLGVERHSRFRVDSEKYRMEPTQLM